MLLCWFACLWRELTGSHCALAWLCQLLHTVATHSVSLTQNSRPTVYSVALPLLCLPLLRLQHTSGGCILGDALEDGSAGPRTVGSLKGAANVVVADLSAVPLPRVSPQMTAYLYGYHVASTRYGGSSGNSSNSNSASA